MKTFTEIDKHEGRCTEAEINQPWEDRWGIPDLQAGLCIPLALGKRRTPSESGRDMEQPVYTEEEEFIPSDAVLELAKARGVPLDDGDAIFGLAFELDPSGAMKKFPTVYLDWNRQKRLARDNKASQAAQLADMTATKLKALPTQDILVKIMQGIFDEDEDTRDRILARMGVNVAELVEMIEEADI